MRAVAYTRYSSDKQSDRSIEDQAALCETYALREGLLLSKVYSDRALSGASTVDRLGLARLMQDARAGAFDYVVVESLDRLARDQEDLAHLFKRLRHLNIEIRTVHAGRADELQVGLAGLMGALYLRDLAAKTHRGMAGRVRDGLSAGGLSYGYRLVDGRKGEIEPDPETSAVVLRVFRAYVDGTAPRDIAAELNRDAIPAPRGGHWNGSTINGSRQRANGVINNALYAGRLIWNRQRFVKDPDTGKRVSRPNPPEAWITAERPELRIVPDELWQTAQARKAGRPTAAPAAQRGAPRRHLLSGLLKCGCCGSSYAAAGSDKRGPVFACSRWRESRSCNNAKKIAMADAEAKILSGIDQHLADPELVSEYVREWHRRTAELEAADCIRRQDRGRRLAEIDKKIAAIVGAIENGLATRAMGERLRELEAEREEVVGEGAGEAETSNVVAFQPGLVESYRRQVASLRSALDELQSKPDRQRISAMLRKLIEKIDVVPGEPYKPVTYVIHGQLAAILEASQGPEKLVGKLVAGARFELTTFRL